MRTNISYPWPSMQTKTRALLILFCNKAEISQVPFTSDLTGQVYYDRTITSAGTLWACPSALDLPYLSATVGRP